MVSYIFHVAILLSICYLFYRFLLARETFFQLHRWVLVGCILLSFGLPLLQIPQNWSLQSTIVFKANSTKYLMGHPKSENSSPPKYQAIEKIPLTSSSNYLIENKPLKLEKIPIQIWSWSAILRLIYGCGVLIFGVNFLIQLISLLHQRYNLPTIEDEDYRIVELKEEQAPYSFWNNIFINPSQYDWSTYNDILAHEKIHVAEKHTFDILLAELMIIFQWFNPFAWLYRKAIDNNLEFLTDKKMLTQGTDKQAYQMNLLKVAVPNFPLSIGTHYNQSFLKQRIMMMNSKQSSLRSSWKYLFIALVLGLSVMTLNKVAMATNNTKKEQSISEKTKTSDAVKSQQIVDLEVSGVWTGNIRPNEVSILFKNKKEGWGRKTVFKKTALSSIPTTSIETFTIKRAAGTIYLKGQFENEKGTGTYEFKPDAAFKTYLQTQGFEEFPNEVLFHCFLTNIDKTYLMDLKQVGYEASNDDLTNLAVHAISINKVKERLASLKELDYSKPTLEELVHLEIHEVTLDYIKSLQTAGYQKMTYEDLTSAKIHNVTPAYIKNLETSGVKNLSLEEVSGFSVHHVTPDFIKSLADLGYKNLSNDDILGAKIHRIDADFIKSVKAMGFKNVSFEEVIGLKIHHVTPKYVASLKKAGFKNLTAEEVTGLSIHHIDPSFSKTLANLGFKNLSNEDIMAAKIHGIDAEFVASVKEMGFKNVSFEDVVGLKIHHVTPKYVASLKKAGFKNLTAEEVTGLSIHHIDPSFSKTLANLGFKNLSNDDIMAAKIHGINAEFMASVKAMGFKNVSFEEVVGLKIHRVTIDDIKDWQQAGYNNLTAEDAVSFRIHRINADFINEMAKAGYPNLSSEDIMTARVHQIDENFINQVKKMNLKKVSMEDIIQLKVHSGLLEFIEQAQKKGKTGLTIEEYHDLMYERKNLNK